MSKNVKIKRKLFVTPILVIRGGGGLTKMGVTGRDTGWPPILVTPLVIIRSTSSIIDLVAKETSCLRNKLFCEKLLMNTSV